MKSKIKVCLVSSTHNPFDDRIFFKEACSLAKEGFDTKLIVPADKKQVVNGIQIIPIKKCKGHIKRMIMTLNIFFTILQKKCHIIHFHDHELIPFSLILKLTGKKVIYDVHENFIGQMAYREWIKPKWLKKVFIYIIKFLWILSGVFFDKIIVAEPQICGYFPKDKCEIIRNFVILNLFKEVPSPQVNKNSKYVLIYAGGLSRARGIKEIIKAMSYLNDAQLWLLGQWESEKFFEECRSLNGWEKTQYLGFVKMNEVYGYLTEADVGLVILFPSPHYKKSLPIKAFEYMAAGLPMVMSDFPLWRELFGKSALFADPFSPEDIASKIARILNDEELYANLSSAGRYMVEKEFNWERESQKLINLYQKISES